MTYTPEIEALAAAWASIDGKLTGFNRGREGDDYRGYYRGYLAEAQELSNRLKKRGFTIIPTPVFEVKS